jgi:hypothetical protein
VALAVLEIFVIGVLAIKNYIEALLVSRMDCCLLMQLDLVAIH